MKINLPLTITSELSEPAALETLQVYSPPTDEFLIEKLKIPLFSTSILSLALAQVNKLLGPPRASQLNVLLPPTSLLLVMGITITLPSGDTAARKITLLQDCTRDEFVTTMTIVLNPRVYIYIYI